MSKGKGFDSAEEAENAEGWYAIAKLTRLIKDPIADRMINMNRIVCHAEPERNYAGTRFSCCLPRGHKGKHQKRPDWETYAALRFVIGAGYLRPKAESIADQSHKERRGE